MEKLDHITVRVADLYEQVKLMLDDGIEIAELSIMPPDDFDGETLPAQIVLSGHMPDDPLGSVDYDPVEAVDVD